MFESADNGVLWVGQVGLFGRHKKDLICDGWRPNEAT